MLTFKRFFLSIELQKNMIMNKIYILLLLAIVFTSCSTSQQSTNTAPKGTESTASQDDEWEVVVFDGEFESFLNSRARPRTMFTEETLHSRNQLLVSEWNSRYYASAANRNVYEVSIDFDSNTKYGFEFEYRLYQFFAFVSWKFGEKFTGLSQSDVIRN